MKFMFNLFDSAIGGVLIAVVLVAASVVGVKLAPTFGPPSQYYVTYTWSGRDNFCDTNGWGSGFLVCTTKYADMDLIRFVENHARTNSPDAYQRHIISVVVTGITKLDR